MKKANQGCLVPGLFAFLFKYCSVILSLHEKNFIRIQKSCLFFKIFKTKFKVAAEAQFARIQVLVHESEEAL